MAGAKVVAHTCNPTQEIRRTVVQSQAKQIVPETLNQKKKKKKVTKRAGRVAQSVGPEFKPLYCKKKKKK
jgi:hypothetical protein